MICAKALYAQEMNGVMPKLNDNADLDLKDAYHPLLYLSNKQKNKPPTHRPSIFIMNSVFSLFQVPMLEEKALR